MERLLVVADDPAAARRGLDTALQISLSFGSGLSLLFLDPGRQPLPQGLDAMESLSSVLFAPRRANAFVPSLQPSCRAGVASEIEALVGGLPPDAVQYESVASGRVAETVLQVMLKLAPDLVLLSPGSRASVLSPAAQDIVLASRTPVWLGSSRGPSGGLSPRRILCAVDSAGRDAAVAWSSRFAGTVGAEVTIVDAEPGVSCRTPWSAWLARLPLPLLSVRSQSAGDVCRTARRVRADLIVAGREFGRKLVGQPVPSPVVCV